MGQDFGKFFLRFVVCLVLVASILTVDVAEPVREMTVNFILEEAEKIKIEKEIY